MPNTRVNFSVSSADLYTYEWKSVFGNVSQSNIRPYSFTTPNTTNSTYIIECRQVVGNDVFSGWAKVGLCVGTARPMKMPLPTGDSLAVNYRIETTLTQ